MSAPTGQQASPSIGVDPTVHAIQQGQNPFAPGVIAGQFAAAARPSGSAEPVATPGIQPPASATTQPESKSAEGDKPVNDGLVSTTIDLAAMFDGVENTEQLFDAVTHTIGDKEYTLSEIVAGFKSQPDALQILNQRDQMDAEFSFRAQQQLEAHDESMRVQAQIQSELEGMMSQDESPEKLAELLARNPVAYQAKRLEMETRKTTLANSKAEMERQREAQQKKLAIEQSDFADRESRRLVERFPEWADSDKGPVVRAKLGSYAQSMGFSDKELANITDHRFLLVLRDAAMGSEMTKKGVKAIASAKDKKLPAPVAKPQSRGELPSADETMNSGRAASFKNHLKDKSVASAADLFTRMIA